MMENHNAPATLQEIAEALGITKKSTEKQASKGNWPYSANPIRGGLQRLYPLETLPQPVRDAVDRWRSADAMKAASQNLASWAKEHRVSLSSRQLEDPETWKKLHVFRVLKESAIYNRDGSGRTARARALAAYYGKSEATIWRWERDVESWAMPKAAPRLIVGEQSLPLPASRSFDEPALRLGLQIYGQNIRRGAKSAYQTMQIEAAKQGWKTGDYTSFTRLIDKIPEAIWDACRRGMVAVERDYVMKVTRSWLDVEAYSVLCGDQNVDDCEAVDPVTGEILIMNDYLWIDCSSRGWVGMWPAFGPYNKYTVAYSLRMAFQRAFADQIYTDWGRPEVSKNTKELVLGLNRFAKLGTFEDMAELYRDIPNDPDEEGLEHRKAQAGVPWHKPIEPQMNVYRRMRLDMGIPGFRQRSNEAWENKVIQTEVKRQRKAGELWTIEQHLEARLAMLHKHNTTQMKAREGGGTYIVPEAILNASLAKQPGRMRADQRTVDLLFLPRREITPRQSSVAMAFPDGTRTYSAMELSRLKKGERVWVHADPFDQEAPAIISIAGEFYCLAERKWDINPVTRDGLSDQISEQRRLLKWWRGEVEKLVGLKVGDRGLVRIGKASKLAKRAEEEKANRIQAKDDRARAESKIIQLAGKKA